MRWRDIRFEKPTVADSDEDWAVLMLHRDGKVGSYGFGNTYKTIAWMPLSELPDPPDRIPDPPEGWRFVQAGEAFDARAKYWNVDDWDQSQNDKWVETFIYIVPIKPPEPQYRPYNAAELIQTIGKLVDGIAGYRAMITGANGNCVYCQGQTVNADVLLSDHLWTDGGKCGVRVE